MSKWLGGTGGAVRITPGYAQISKTKLRITTRYAGKPSETQK